MIKRIINYFSEGIPDYKSYQPGFTGLYRYLQNIITDIPPGLARLMKIQPVFAFFSGLACIFLLRKGFSYAPIIIFTSVFAVFYVIFRIYRLRGKKSLMKRVWDLALLLVLNDMLFFIIPFYFESMTLFSRNITVAPILIILAVTANQIYLYKRWVARYPLVSAIFFSLIFFFVLNIIFPIIFGMRNIWSLSISGSIASLTAILYVYPHLGILKSRKNGLLFTAGVVIFFISLWFGRSLIPPSPLRLIEATACETIFNNDPLNPFTANSYEEGERIYFYSAIFAPRGLKERIVHIWYYNGNKFQTVNLKEITGGREKGYRTWSFHTVREKPGKYAVEVWTAGGQLLGRRDFILE